MLKTRRAALVLGGGALVMFACVATQVQPPEMPVRPVHRPTAAYLPATAADLQQRVLPSGMRVLWDEAPPGSLAGVVSVVRGGSRLDPPGAEGLAHLVEHLTYRAVDPGDPSATTRWNRLIHDAVAEMNGFTSPDCLIFYELAAPAALSALVALETARLADPLAGVDERSFELEREIVGSENLLRADPRMGQWPVTQMFPRLFPAGHPYARPTGGTDASRSRLTVAQARDYARTVFRPENMTLLVTAPAGALSLDTFIEGLPAALRAGPGGRPAPTGSTAAAQKPAEVPAAGTPVTPASQDASAARPIALARVPSPLPTSELWLAWTLPGSYGEQGPAEELLAAWLQADLQAGQLAKEDSGVLYTAARFIPGVEAGVLFVRTLLADKARPEHVAQVVAARVTSLWSREPTSRPILGELRSRLQAERLLGEPRQVERAVSLATEAALGGRARAMPVLMSAVEGVSNSSVAQLAYQALTSERGHATLYAPESPGRGGALHAADAAAVATAGAVHELVPGAGSWDVRELRAITPAAPTVKTTRTASGLTVVTARRPGVSAIALLGFRGGYVDASPPLLVELALRTRPDARRAPALHMLPGRGATRDLSFDAIEFRPDRVNEALALLFAKATTMVNDWPAHDELTRLLAPLAAAEAADQNKADSAFWRALFGDHRDARLLNTGDLDGVTRADVDAWVGRVHNVRNAALVVVGDVDPVLVARAAEVLSKENSRPTWVAEIPTPRAPSVRPAGPERTVPVVTARPTTLVDLRLGCLLPSMTPADGAHHELLARAVEARLNDAIRIEQGDGYGVNVTVERLRDGATYLALWTYVPEHSLTRTLSVLHDHWRRWGQTGFEPSELNVARWRAAGAFAATVANPDLVAMKLLDRWSAAPAALASTSLAPDLAAAGAKRVNELFATCRANAVLGLTGDETHIRHALDQAWPGLR